MDGWRPARELRSIYRLEHERPRMSISCFAMKFARSEGIILAEQGTHGRASLHDANLL